MIYSDWAGLPIGSTVEADWAHRMIDFREFAVDEMRHFEFAGSGEGLHLRFVDGMILRSSGGGGAKPECAPK